jgi:hypothetical protein
MVTCAINTTVGFAITMTSVPSLCGAGSVRNFTGNESRPTIISFPIAEHLETYKSSINCFWHFKAPTGKILEVKFNNLNLEDSEACEKESLMIEDEFVKEYITEGEWLEVCCSSCLSHESFSTSRLRSRSNLPQQNHQNH